MTRYFYTDPLAAAWMAKHHGMVFVSPADGVYPNDDYADAITQMEFDGRAGFKFTFYGSVQRYYIHPDSLHLLAPQHGDTGIVDSGNCFRYDANRGTLKGCWMAASSLCFGFTTEPRIIQRNGLAFISPESEG